MKSKPPKLFKFTRKSEKLNETEFETGGPTNHFRRSTSFASEIPEVDQGKAKTLFLKISAKSHTEDDIDLDKIAATHDLINQKTNQSTEFHYDDGSGTIRCEKNLVEYLENQKKYIPGSKIFFKTLKRPPITLRASHTVIDDKINCEVRQENSSLEELNPLLAFKLFRSRIS